MSRADRVKKLADMLANARYESGKSQEWLAAELGVSRHSIINWEKGISSPDFFTTSEWFNALGINPTRFFLQLFNEELDGITPSDSSEEISIALHSLIDQLNEQQKRAVLYLLFGSYQGDPNAMLQLFVAHAHLPMENRFFIANLIYETYKMCESTNKLKDISHVMPNMNILGNAIEKGKIAASKNEDSY